VTSSLETQGERGSAGSSQFVNAVPSMPTASHAALWNALRDAAHVVAHPAHAIPDGSILESGLSTIATLSEAPSRTLHSTAIMRSSPLSTPVRAMIERREFGRSCDAIEVDLGPFRAKLPGLDCPEGPVEFLASEDSFEALSLSIDCLLQHQRHLLAASVNRALPRRNVLVLGAGPGGLMAAIQMRLRDHRVVLCEPREVYTRNRFIGVYKPVAHLMASLGMPERMTYDFTHYRGKRGIMLADIQTLLHGVALKLGVVIYTGALVRDMNLQALRNGEVELQRSTRGGDGAQGASAIGMTRWHYDTISRVRSGVTIRFDTVFEATGGRSGARELLVGADNVVSMRTVARDAALRDPSLNTYFDDPEDHCAKFVETDYGCPPEARRKYAAQLMQEGRDAIPDELPGLVSNIDASIVAQPIEPTKRPAGRGARLGDKELDIPRDWVLVRCPLPDRTLTRYQIEGPLPQSFEFGGKRVPTRDVLTSLNPVTLLVRILYAMGVPFEAVDRQRLVDFYTQESSQGDASDVVAAFVGTFRGLRLGGKDPIWCGRVPGSSNVEYGIIGEALQNAWYRFGVGVDDTFAGAIHFAHGLDLEPEARKAHARRFENVMTSRGVQVFYHLSLVNQNTDQGVVGPVLTECYIDRRYRADLAEARLREVGRNAAAMLATLIDLRSSGGDPLLEAALEHKRDTCGRTLLNLLGSFEYDHKFLDRASQAMKLGAPDWRVRALSTLGPVVSQAHGELLAMLADPGRAKATAVDARVRTERLVELGLGRYDWASPWVRACALRALDPTAEGAVEVLARAAAERDPLVAETAAAVLAAARQGLTVLTAHPDRLTLITMDKVVLLKEVSVFNAIAHEELVEVATLLTDRWASPGERIVEQGELGDCLYVIASGAVRIHDRERTLAQLTRKQFFGELSLLDAEPRSASVTATEETHLFRLGQSDFYSLVADRPQIVHAINRGLCQMVRGVLRLPWND
jgi:CRP/FNR family transcriptional regulator, cyclic AMP receptor protein